MVYYAASYVCTEVTGGFYFVVIAKSIHAIKIEWFSDKIAVSY